MRGLHEHRVVVIERAMLGSADEEVVLIYVYLDAGRSSVKILEGLGTVLRRRNDDESRMVGGREYCHTCISFGSPLRYARSNKFRISLSKFSQYLSIDSRV